MKGREGKREGRYREKEGIPSTHKLVLRSAFSILSVPCPLRWIGGQVYVSMIEQMDGWMDQ